MEAGLTSSAPPTSPQARPAKRRRWLVIIILLAAALILACPTWVGLNFAYWLLWGAHKQTEANQRQILYKINAPAVLAAARQVHAQKGTYRPDPNWNPPSQDYPDPDDPKMPAVLRALPKHYISIQPSCVMIEMGGGFYHYGLIAYMPGAVPGPELRTLQLIPGLWYYAEDNRIPPP